eukprot:1318672-Rhodomonas_salina.1
MELRMMMMAHRYTRSRLLPAASTIPADWPRVLIYQPRPLICQHRPLICQPRPLICQPRPLICQPRPLYVSIIAARREHKLTPFSVSPARCAVRVLALALDSEGPTTRHAHAHLRCPRDFSRILLLLLIIILLVRAFVLVIADPTTAPEPAHHRRHGARFPQLELALRVLFQPRVRVWHSHMRIPESARCVLAAFVVILQEHLLKVQQVCEKRAGQGV